MFTIKVKQSRPPCQGGRLDGYKSYNILQDLLFLDIQKIQYLCRFQGLWLDKMSEGRGQNVGG